MRSEDQAPEARALPGLEGELEVVRELGRGGSSIVYLAIERELGREVAVKTIHPLFATDADAVARLVREARTLARLEHPNIVTFYGVRRLADGGLAMLMQYVRGERLKDRIRGHGRLGVDESRRILADVARALAHAHRFHVVHRDIKPENIYLDATLGIARLSDFGIARSWDGEASLTQAGLAIGTPAYMAPEQIDGAPLDGRSDLYSLGLVGYEMLTGERPWNGQNLYGIIYSQKHETLPPLRSARADLPDDLVAAIEGAIQKDPALRWASAEAFLAHLGETPAAAPAAADVSVVRPVAAEAVAPPEDSLTVPYRPGDVVPAGSPGDAPLAASAGDAIAAAAMGEVVGAALPGDDAAADPPAEVRQPATAGSVPDDDEDEAPAASPNVPGDADTAVVMAQVAAALRVDGGAAAEPAPSAAARWRRPRRREAAAIAAVLTLLLLGGGIGAFAAIRRGTAGRTSDPAPVSLTPMRAVPPGSTPATVRLPAARKVTSGATTAQAESMLPPPPQVVTVMLPVPDRPVPQPPADPQPRLLGKLIGPRPGESAAPALARESASTSPLAVPAAGAPAAPADRSAPSPAATSAAEAPAFTPLTLAPQLRNPADVRRALAERLREMGRGGKVMVGLFVDEHGTVLHTRVDQSSGDAELDRAALEVADSMKFAPALVGDRPVAVWVSVPIAFAVR